LFKYQAIQWYDIKKSKKVTHKILVDWRYSQHHNKLVYHKGFGYFSLWCMFTETDKSLNPYANLDQPCYFLAPAITLTKGLNKFPLNLALYKDKIIQYTFKKLSQQTMLINEISPVEGEIKAPPHLYDPDRIKKILCSEEFQRLQREYQNKNETGKD
jgi:hypothetical protein